MPPRLRARAGRHALPQPPHRSRRRLGVWTLLAGVAVSVALVLARLPGGRGVAASAFEGPIVLISVDTLRADRVSAYGRARQPTPAIDGLAADGVLFERAYSHAPQTLPAHASIFTGRLPPHHGVRDNVGFKLGADAPTLAGSLEKGGYRTGGFVSAYVLRAETGIGAAFDHYDASLPPGIGTSMGSLRRSGADTVAAADRWIGEQPDNRFFLFVHLYEPHRPWRLPPPYSAVGGYDGAVTYADAIVGQLIERLRHRGLYGRALIVLLSDHGEGLGDHGEEEHGVFLYDEAVHVPLIVKLPEAHRAGTRVAALVQHVDLFPTLADLTGLSSPPGLDGLSLRGLLDGTSRLPERGIYAEALYPLYHFGWSALYSLTDSRFRYVQAPTAELYDLRDDPGERHNLAAARVGPARAMDGALARIATASPVDTPGRVTPEERERLQALGYVGQTPSPVGGSTPLVDPKHEIRWLERYREGIRLGSERRFDEAVRAFHDVVAHHPEMVDVWTQLGQTQIRIGRYHEGIAALQRAIALNPSATDAVLAVASAYLRVGEHGRAAEHARLALARDPARAHEVLARVALARGLELEALEEARKAEGSDPDLPLPAFIQGTIHHDARRFEEAIPLLQQAAARLAPRRLELRELYYTLGDALANLGRYAEAEWAFLRELASFPENNRARASLAMVYAAQGRQADAERALAAIVATTPTPASYELAARTLAIVGDPRAAATMAQRGLRAFPDHAGLRRLARQGPS